MSDVIARAHGAARIAVRVYLNVVAALLRALNREIGDADVHCAAAAYVRRLGERLSVPLKLRATGLESPAYFLKPAIQDARRAATRRNSESFDFERSAADCLHS